MENPARRNLEVRRNSSSSSLQTSSRFRPLEPLAYMEGQSSSSSSSRLPEFKHHQNLSTSTTPIACVSFSTLQPLALFGQAPSSPGPNSSPAVIPPTACTSSNCSCNSPPLPLNSLIPSPFSPSSLPSFFPAHVAQQCSFMPCSSSSCRSPAPPPLIQPTHRRRGEATSSNRKGPHSSPSSSLGVVRLSSLASLASAVQAFSHSSAKGGRESGEDEHVQQPGDENEAGARPRRKQESGLGMASGALAAANSSVSRGIARLFQQVPRELEGFRRHRYGIAEVSGAAVAAKQRRGVDYSSSRAQAPHGSEVQDSTEEKESVTASTQETRTRKKKAIQTSQHLLAGAIAAMVSRTIVAPLERLKVEYLVRGAKGSVPNTLQTILKNEGLGGFWKGNGVNLLRTAPFKSVNFFCYDSYRNYLLKIGKRREITNLERLAAGAAAGVTATILCFPLDTIRTTMVAPGGEALGGLIGCFNHMVRTEGFLSLYKGLLPAVVSMAPSGAVFYGVYDMLKMAYLNSPKGKQMLEARRKRMKEVKERGEEAWVQPELGPVRTLLFGALAGACAESVTYPFEVVRRAQQLQHAAVKLGMAGTIQMLVKKGGVKALYAGLFPSTLQVLPSAAFSYFVYETMKIAFKIP